jgi:hypothetical protein
MLAEQNMKALREAEFEAISRPIRFAEDAS